MKIIGLYFIVYVFIHIIIKSTYFYSFFDFELGTIFTASILLKPINILLTSVYNSYLVYFVLYILNIKIQSVQSIIKDTVLFSTVFFTSDLYGLFASIILDNPSIFFKPHFSLFNYLDTNVYNPIFSYALSLFNIFELSNLILYNLYIVGYCSKVKVLIYFNIVSATSLIIWGLLISFLELLNR
jgi:hypothetical protein